MEQLSLFSSKTSQTARRARNRRPKNMLSREVVLSSTRWDLWTQETEEEKEMALFFLDIRNFTPITERHQAFDVIHIVRKLFSTFQNLIRIHHGRIIETTGDGFYAAFGFDSDVKKAVNAAVQSGMGILETLDRLNSQSLGKSLGQYIEVGIGVHVGKVAAGNLRLGPKDHFVVMGYPVNVASRLQAATKELNNSFVVSSDVVKLLEKPLTNTSSVSVNLKGVSGIIDVHLIGKPYA